MTSENKDGGGGCATLFVILLAVAALFWGLSAVGHVLGLTPTASELSDRPDGWVSDHYRGVGWGYALTVVLLTSVGALLWLAVRSQSEVAEQAQQARLWATRALRVVVVLVIAIVVLPIGKRPGVETAPGVVGSAREGNVPSLIGMSAAEADDALENENLDAAFEETPTDDEGCNVVDQNPPAGGEVEEYGDVKLRCEVRVPGVVGKKASAAESRLSDVGLDVRFTNEPSDYDLDRCRVRRQSRSGSVPPNATISLRLKCTKPPPQPMPDPTPERTPEAQEGACEPGYSPCVPVYPPDVDCADTGPVVVTGSDPHGLDRDRDGVACGGD